MRTCFADALAAVLLTGRSPAGIPADPNDERIEVFNGYDLAGLHVLNGDAESTCKPLHESQNMSSGGLYE